jgi:hypothetical protein
VLLLEDVAPLLVQAIRTTEWRPERRRASQAA